jgi:iron complex outermembrane receptor protein
MLLHLHPGACAPARAARRLTLATGFVLTATAAAAQQSLPADRAASAASPGRAASAPGRAASAAAASGQQRIEITGGRNSDVDERRQSTAAKIVIGREEIDKFGDANVGEVLRRLPGVTTPGAPGRGGPPRMRGLGNGFTQLLIDGQRVPPGFSLESLTPDQVERIEVLRAPTAETGSQAIAGTINIITREGYKRRLNDLRGNISHENGKLTPGLNWTHNDSAGDLSYNISGGAFAPRRENSNTTHTVVTDIDKGTLLEDRTSTSSTAEKRWGSNITGRLQWKLGEAGDQIALNPNLFHTEAHSDTNFNLVRAPSARPGPQLFDDGTSVNDSRFTNARLGLNWRQRFGPVRLETNGTGGSFTSVNDTLRTENTRSPLPGSARVLSDNATVREKSVNLTVKGSGVAGSDTSEHNLVSGAEIDASRREERRKSLQNGADLLAGFDDSLQARAVRTAAYVQDEWNVNPGWALQGGLRWEGITTRGDNGATTGERSSTNRSGVLTPLFHAVWKPDPKRQDRVRLSLTRSYRPPALANLVAKPSITRDYDVSIANTFTSPDSAGNPDLKPELATGIDLAFERYLDGGGILSANLFHRQISELMRGVTRLETVSWSPVQRYVRRMQNIGDATTSGLELDGKFRLDQLIPGSLPIDLRGNLSFFDSRVKDVPGPNNRLDQQAKATGNIGADYRIRAVPLTLGGNVNWVPGYTTKTEVGQFTTVSTKTVWDLYALWTFSPTVALRLLGSNLDPRDYTNTTVSEVQVKSGANERTTVGSTGPSYINWALRLEMKL